MANEQIKDQTEETTPAGADVVPIDKNSTNVTYKVQLSNLPKAFTVTAPITNTGGALAVSAASTSASGVAELATTAETDTGTDAARVVTPDGLAGSVHGIKHIAFTIANASTTPATGDGQAHFVIPAGLNGMNVVAVMGVVTTVSSSGTPTFALRRERSGSAVDVLSTNVTIDANEKTSSTAATPAVINASNDDLATADILYVDLDTVGTGAKGHQLVVSVQLP